MTAQQEKTKVLVIDDERLIRLTLNAKLKQVGYTAVCVASIPEAVARSARRSEKSARIGLQSFHIRAIL